MIKKIISALLLVASAHAFAQSDSLAELDGDFKWSGYVEAYYGFDFNEPLSNNRPDFLYAYNRHNEFSLHLALLQVAYDKDRVRAKIGFMAGSYPTANLAHEPNLLQSIYEASGGVKLSKDQNLWLDAGIFSSHIGSESAVGKDCWTLSRSMMAENSPYYESGAKISYTSKRGHWFVSLLVLNGWQRMQREAGSKSLAFGHQLTYKWDDKFLVNSSSFVGKVNPAPLAQWRYFHNLYAIAQIDEKWGLTVGFDLGVQQVDKGSQNYHSWYAPVVIGKYSLSNEMSLSGRVEYYCDKNQVVIPTNTDGGFQTLGYSINWDYQLAHRVVWRVEVRSLKSKDAIFSTPSQRVTSNFAAVTSLAVSL